MWIKLNEAKMINSRKMVSITREKNKIFFGTSDEWGDDSVYLDDEEVAAYVFQQLFYMLGIEYEVLDIARVVKDYQKQKAKQEQAE